MLGRLVAHRSRETLGWIQTLCGGRPARDERGTSTGWCSRAWRKRESGGSGDAGAGRARETSPRDRRRGAADAREETAVDPGRPSRVWRYCIPRRRASQSGTRLGFYESPSPIFVVRDGFIHFVCLVLNSVYSTAVSCREFQFSLEYHDSARTRTLSGMKHRSYTHLDSTSSCVPMNKCRTWNEAFQNIRKLSCWVQPAYSQPIPRFRLDPVSGVWLPFGETARLRGRAAWSYAREVP